MEELLECWVEGVRVWGLGLMSLFFSLNAFKLDQTCLMGQSYDWRAWAAREMLSS